MRACRGALLLSLLLLPAAAAQEGSVGVVPAERVTPGLLRESEYAFEVQLQSSHETARSATLSLSGPAAPWARVPAGPLAIPARGLVPVDVVVRIPADAPSGPRELLVTATFDAAPAPDGTGLGVAPSITSRLLLEVSGEERRDLRLLRAEAADVEEGQGATAVLHLENFGNVREDLAGRLVVHRETDGAVVADAAWPDGLFAPPLRPGRHELPVPALPQGQYVATLLGHGVELSDRFKVVPPGTLGKEAVLRALDFPATVSAGAPLRVAGSVENVGSARIARAVLEVEAWKDGALLDRAASEPVLLDPGAPTTLPVYLRLEAPGRVLLRAVLVYDGWRTAPTESHVTVEAPPPSLPGGWLAAGAGMAALVGAAYLWGRRGAGRQP